MQYDFGKKPENRRCRNQRSVGPWRACTNDLPDAKISLSSVKFSEKIQPEGFTPSRVAPQTGAANAGGAWAPPNRTPMATFYTHDYTHGYLLLSWPHSWLHFMQMATLKATFKTYCYTHGYILRSWLHFTLMATRTATFCTHGYTHGYILHSCLRPLMA